MPFNNELPEWNKTATAPTTTKKNAGWSAGEKPPASIFDWFFNTTFKALEELQQEAINMDQKGVVNGVAPLDSAGKIPATHIPATANPTFVNLTLLNGATTALSRTPRYTKVGKEVTIEGELSAGIASGTTIGNIPSGFRPPTDRIIGTSLNSSGANSGATFWIKTSGDIVLLAVANSTNSVSLMGLKYFVD